MCNAVGIIIFPFNFWLSFQRLCRVLWDSNLTQSTSPATWNALPDHIRTVVDPVKFRKLLISHYFSQAFNVC